MAKGGGESYTGLRDMIDGGGAGQSGQTFEGGPFSAILNDVGVRPMGYRDRLTAARPMARPQSFGQPRVSTMGQPRVSTMGQAQPMDMGYPSHASGMLPLQMQGPIQALNHPGNVIDPSLITQLVEESRSPDPRVRDKALEMLDVLDPDPRK